MEKAKQSSPDIDVTDESYRGTSRVVASAGYIYLSHLGATLGGMLALGTAAYVAHGKVNNLVKGLHDFAEKGGRIRKGAIRFIVGDRPGSHELSNVVKEMTCITPEQKKELAQLVSNEELSFFQHKASELTDWLSKRKIGGFIEKQSTERMQATFIGASLGAISGWLTSTIWSIHKGTHEGNKGKHQFIRAKEQIKNLQEDNADLNKINDELHAKYVKAATRLDSIDAAREAALRSDAPAADTLAALESAATPPHAEVQLDSAQHQGTVTQQERASAVA